ncbi:NUDIX hydrolase domain-like protein [Fusarium flagelliforme]|uniref:NUDIX hydrolase domain-like protein n=1 Tax=Fusarium flagelliforme TaxID=2675880 RepID=UPI001E8CE30B|nr:NUDIX hydrolase domain-like protein [Fusarium flagelliforme]KAH7173625.1 NUDIX hydrolase domain-like protein [Fusarium flagelliforme]
MAKTSIDLIDEVDMFPYAETDSAAFKSMKAGLYTLTWEDSQGVYPIGYVLDRVVKELHRVPEDVRGKMICDEAERTIALFQEPTEEERTRRVAALADYWRQKGTFPLLRGWRNELWPVYGRTGELLFSMERAAMGLIGTMRYGVHMVAYVKDDTSPYGVRLWVPTRARNKSTFPGMLDNTVAGGLMTGEDPFECVIREADEEASLPESTVRQNAKFVGNVTYIYITDEGQVGEGGFIYPECQWVYHLELSNDVIPQPKDGEAERFDLCDVDQVKTDLAGGRFKPNCALVTLDFFIRHGILTDENEPKIEQIKRRVRRDIPFPGPHQSNWRPL